MKFNIENAPNFPDETLVGNVYRCKGGNKSKYWIIVAASREVGIVCLGINEKGEITSSGNYGLHVFEGYPWSREPIGRVNAMPSLEWEIQWNKFPL